MPNYKPEGYSTVTPYLTVKGASRLIDFIRDVLGGEVTLRMGDDPVGHAEMRVGDSLIMLADAQTSDSGQPMPAMLYVYVRDADAVYEKALAAGAKSVREPADQFYGDRSAAVTDAFGNQWWFATHIEDVPPEEMERRVKAQATA